MAPTIDGSSGPSSWLGEEMPRCVLGEPMKVSPCYVPSAAAPMGEPASLRWLDAWRMPAPGLPALLRGAPGLSEPWGPGHGQWANSPIKPDSDSKAEAGAGGTDAGADGGGRGGQRNRRPAKPKRLRGKALAERLFRAQWCDDEEEYMQAHEAFMQETFDDALLANYTRSVLRCLNEEANVRAADGEDPLQTHAHL